MQRPPYILNFLCALKFFVIMFLLPMTSHAASLGNTWTFSAGTYSGSFVFSNLDTTQSYLDSTAAGFTATLNNAGYDTSNVFSYDAVTDVLIIGGSDLGASRAVVYPDSTDTGLDWRLQLNSFSINPIVDGFFVDLPGSSDPLGVRLIEGTISVASVPEPATIALLGLGFVGICIYRRRNACWSDI